MCIFGGEKTKPLQRQMCISNLEFEEREQALQGAKGTNCYNGRIVGETNRQSMGGPTHLKRAL